MSYPKKTAFEKFLDDTFFLGGNNRNVIPKETIDYYLQLEKEQIEQAFDKGHFFSTDYFREVQGMDEAEAYYHKEYVEPKLKEESLAKSNKRHREIWLKSKEK